MIEQMERMEQRITNLEVAIEGLWDMLKDSQPSDTQEKIDDMIFDLSNINRTIGGFRRGYFTTEG